MKINYIELYKHLNNAVKCTSKDRNRPSLNCVRVYTQDIFLIVEATDSYIAYKAKIAILDSFPIDVTLTREQIKTFPKLPFKEFFITINENENYYNLNLPNSIIQIKKDKYNFPNTDKIYNDVENNNELSIKLDSKKLQQILSTCDGTITIKVSKDSTKKPLLITSKDNYSCVIMPMM